MSLRRVIRHKVFVIPYNGKKMMMVQDKETDEWGFVSGGVKRNEERDPIVAAQRELNEETSGLMPFIPRDVRTSIFMTDYRTKAHLENDKKKRQTVISRYVVFWFPIPPSMIDVLETKFKPNDEIKKIKVVDFHTFKKNKGVKIWEVCEEFMNNLKK